MKKVLNLLKMDFKLIVRDKITLVMALSPAILILIYFGVMGNAAGGGYVFAVNKNMPAEIIQNLEHFGEIEYYESEASLKERVLRWDSVAGISYDNQELKIILEGNECEVFASQIKTLLTSAKEGALPEFSLQVVESKSSRIIKLISIYLIFFALFVAGAVPGFNIVMERETKAIKALAVSPLGLKSYIFARSLMALVIALINIALCAYIIGQGQNILPMLIITFFSLPLLGLIALGLGSVAQNQIAAIGAVKLLMPLSMVVPGLNLILAEKWHFLLYWMPNYWQFKALEDAWNGNINWFMCIMLLFVSFIWFIPLYKGIQKKLQLN